MSMVTTDCLYVEGLSFLRTPLTRTQREPLEGLVAALGGSFWLELALEIGGRIERRGVFCSFDGA